MSLPDETTIAELQPRPARVDGTLGPFAIGEVQLDGRCLTVDGRSALWPAAGGPTARGAVALLTGSHETRRGHPEGATVHVRITAVNDMGVSPTTATLTVVVKAAPSP